MGSRGSSSILIIEPDSVLAAQYTEYLASLGYRVKAVGTAQAAIVSADKRLPDLVIVEPLLAAHSGIEFIYEFRSYADWTKVPIIINSRVRADVLGVAAEAQRQSGIVAMLYKPELRLAALGREVARALG